jgi:hypothetical protein
MNLRRTLRRLIKGKRPPHSCVECERLSQEEADAAIELVAADSEDVGSLRRKTADVRLLDSRERLKAHSSLHHLERGSPLAVATGE